MVSFDGFRYDYMNWTETPNFDYVEKNGVKVCTTEHLLAALYGMHIDNALIKLNGIEIPIVDGSALPFVKEIEKVGFKAEFSLDDGIKELNKFYKFLIPDQTMRNI